MKSRDVALAIPFCPDTHRVLLITSRKHPNYWICKHWLRSKPRPSADHNNAHCAPLHTSLYLDVTTHYVRFDPSDAGIALRPSPPLTTCRTTQFPRAASRRARHRAKLRRARRAKKVCVVLGVAYGLWRTRLEHCARVLPSTADRRYADPHATPAFARHSGHSSARNDPCHPHVWPISSHAPLLSFYLPCVPSDHWSAFGFLSASLVKLSLTQQRASALPARYRLC